MNTPDSHPAESDMNHIEQWFKEFESAIAAIPLKELVDRSKIVYGATPIPIRVLDYRAEEIVQILEFEAKLGNEDSICSLRNIGNRIAEILSSLAVPDQNESGNQEELSQQDSTAKNPRKFRNQLQTLKKLLADGKTFLSQFPSALLNDAFASHCPLPRNYLTIRFEGAVVKPVDSDLVLPMRDPISLDDYCKLDPSAKLDRLVDAANSFELLSDDKVRARCSEIAVQRIVELMIGSRISNIFKPVAREAVRKVASESVVWPTSVSAFADKRLKNLNTDIELLQLGKLLPFRLEPGKSGEHRDFRSGTQSAFALEICTLLFIEQKSRSEASQKVRSKMKKIESKLEDDRLHTSIDFKPLEFAQTADEFEPCWDRKNHWKLKAALLPAFPSKDKTPSAETKQSFEKWHEAAMRLAEAMCGGNWDLRKWPDCVEKRSTYDKKATRNRTTKEVVSQKLRDGMERLRPV